MGASLFGFTSIVALFIAGFQRDGYHLLDTLVEIVGRIPDLLSVLRLSKDPNAIVALAFADFISGVAPLAANLAEGPSRSTPQLNLATALS